MKQIFGLLFALMLVVGTVLAPVAVPSVFAQQNSDEGTSGLIPCGNIVDSSGAVVKSNQCTFDHLLELGRNIISYLIALSIPLAAVAFAWAGFLYVSAAGDEGKIKKAKEIFWKVMWGFIFVCAAWLIVYSIVSFLDPCFSLLGPDECVQTPV